MCHNYSHKNALKNIHLKSVLYAALTLLASACGSHSQDLISSNVSEQSAPSIAHILPAPIVTPLPFLRNVDEGSTTAQANHNNLKQEFLTWAIAHSDSRPQINEENLVASLQGLTSTSSRDLKPVLDLMLLEIHSREIRYNISASEPMAPLQKNLLQCSSGTLFFELARRFTANGQAPFDGSSVMILTSGHVLPGYMVRSYNNEWHLFGIETTASGAAEVYYGAAKNLTNEEFIVHADHYIDLLIHGANAVNLLEAARSALINADTDFGVSEEHARNHPIFNSSAVRRMNQLQRTMGRRSYDGASHPLAFGTSDTHRGTRERETIASNSHGGQTFISPEILREPPVTPLATTASSGVVSDIGTFSSGNPNFLELMSVFGLTEIQEISLSSLSLRERSMFGLTEQRLAELSSIINQMGQTVAVYTGRDSRNLSYSQLHGRHNNLPLIIIVDTSNSISEQIYIRTTLQGWSPPLNRYRQQVTMPMGIYNNLSSWMRQNYI